jgi:hypothetical protein
LFVKKVGIVVDATAEGWNIEPPRVCTHEEDAKK